MTADSTTLTPREWQVLQLIAQGCQLPEVAEVLVISYATARCHTAHIRYKLGAATAAAAVYTAFIAQNSTASA